MVNHTSRKDQAHAQASLWIARLQRDETPAPETVAGLQQWLADDIAHQQAFEQASIIWEMLGGIDPAMAQESFANRGRIQQLATVAACLLIAIFFLLTGPQIQPQHISTAIGEQRTIILPDGTEVSLNTNSSIQLLYSGAERRIRLLSGEALFDVAHEAVRPFYVRYPQGLVRDIGTRFLVRGTTEQASVTLIEGELAVRRAGLAHTQDEEIFLKPGERYQFDEKHQSVLIDRPPLASLTAWQSGRAIFHNISVGEAAAEINRYTPHTKISLAPEVARLSISGTFHIGRPYAFAAAIASVHGLTLDEADGRLTLSGATSSGQMSGN